MIKTGYCEGLFHQARGRRDAGNTPYGEAVLMESQSKIRLKKKEVEKFLDFDDPVEFGFEAGRRMERKPAMRT